MKLYQIDYKRLVILLLPTFLRKPKMFALLQSLTICVSELHTRFLKSREVNLLRIQRNGQVCNLRRTLNDELDSDERRISITDGRIEGDWVFVYDESKAYQLLIDSEGVMVYSEDLIVANTAFFYVNVPWTKAEINLNNRLRSYLNQYKLLSKEYIIRYE